MGDSEESDGHSINIETSRPLPTNVGQVRTNSNTLVYDLTDSPPSNRSVDTIEILGDNFANTLRLDETLSCHPHGSSKRSSKWNVARCNRTDSIYQIWSNIQTKNRKLV